MTDATSDPFSDDLDAAKTTPHLNDEIKAAGETANESFDNQSFDEGTEVGGDEPGFITTFIRNQPLLTLSLAFGLGLIATSFIARKQT